MTITFLASATIVVLCVYAVLVMADVRAEGLRRIGRRV